MRPVAVVLGTRPEIIKLAPIISNLGDNAFLIHSRQHYDDTMSSQFFVEMGIREPDVLLEGVGGGSRAEQVGKTLVQLEEVFRRTRPGAVIVQGDTNTVAAGALAANFTGIPLIHVEAGLRSYDRNMPEEINRIIAGVLADIHCAATELNKANLIREGIPESKIIVTGNTIVEVTKDSLKKSKGDSPIPRFAREGYVLSTIHRPENTDDPESLARILDGLSRCPLPVVLIAHPRTQRAIAEHHLAELAEKLIMVTPTNHSEFLRFAMHARVIVSDSGGVQEEVTVLKKPLLVIRRSTERPESIVSGFARLVTPDMPILDTLREALDDKKWPNLIKEKASPYGDGNASRYIADLAQKLASKETVIE